MSRHRPHRYDQFENAARTVVFSCVLMFASSAPSPADSPSQSAPWKKVAGDYVFVMLFANCRIDAAEAIVSSRELELLREMRRPQASEVAERYSWSDGNVPAFESSCRSRMLRIEPRVVKDFGDAALVSMSTSHFTYSQSIRSSTGEPYPASGLYRNDGSVEPLWTVEWFADGAILSADGVHLVRLGPWASSYDDLAVAFYRSGELLKAYSIADLVADPRSLFHSVSHFFWSSSIALDEDAHELTVATLSGETYRFNLEGEILSRTAPPKNEQSIRVHYADGRTEELSGVYTCAGTMYMVASMTEGRAAERRLYAYRLPVSGDAQSERAGSTPKATLIELLHLPYDRIRGIRRTDHDVQRDANTRDWDEKAWLMRLRDGQSILVALDVAKQRLCAEGADGEKKVLVFDGISFIEFL